MGYFENRVPLKPVLGEREREERERERERERECAPCCSFHNWL